MKRRTLRWMAVVILVIGVFSMFGCSTQQSKSDKDIKYVDTMGLYEDEGVLDETVLTDEFFKNCGDSDYAMEKLETYFLSEYDIYDFYIGRELVNDESVKDYIVESEMMSEIAEEYLEDYGESEESEAPTVSGTYYVLNTSSHKFHTSDCSFGKRTKEENKKISYDTSAEIVAQGYSPCGKCCP